MVCLLALVAFITYVKVWETDTWWHLEAGELMAAASRGEGGAAQQLPETDPFSHTREGAEWINDEWLGDYYLYAIYDKFGLKGLQVFVSLMSALIFCALFYAGRRAGGDPLLLAPLLAVAAFASRIRLTPRPEIFTLLLAASFFYLLSRILSIGYSPAGGTDSGGDDAEPADGEAMREKRRIAIVVIMIPVLQALWANFHPGAPLGIVMVFCAIAAAAAAVLINTKAGSAVQPEVSSANMRRLGYILIACIFAILLNPYGTHALVAPLELSGNMVFMKHIAEWAPVPFDEYFRAGGGAAGRFAVPFFFAAGLLAFAAGYKRINIFHVFLFLLTSYMALRARRFMALFAMFAAPVAAAHLSVFAPALLRNKIFRALAVLTIIVAFPLAAYYYGYKDPRFDWGGGIDKRYYPASAIEFIRSEDFQGNMYNTFGLGGPLIHGLYPEHKVFIDGRVPVYGPDLYARVIEFEQAPDADAWNRMQDEFGLTFAVIRSDRPATGQAILRGRGPWYLVYWDRTAHIYAKDTPAHRELIDKNLYEMTDSHVALDRAYAWKKMPDRDRKKVLAELERSLSLSPENLTALRALSYIYYVEGMDEKALETARRGIGVNDRIAGLYAVAGEIQYRNGDKREALESFRKAASIRPEYRDIVKKIEAGEAP